MIAGQIFQKAIVLVVMCDFIYVGIGIRFLTSQNSARFVVKKSKKQLMNQMTIYEKHKLEEKELEFRYQKEREKLRLSLREKQALCLHPSWTRYEELFYALGETYPGEMCDECGQQRHIRLCCKNGTEK